MVVFYRTSSFWAISGAKTELSVVGARISGAEHPHLWGISGVHTVSIVPAHQARSCLIFALAAFLLVPSERTLARDVTSGQPDIVLQAASAESEAAIFVSSTGELVRLSVGEAVPGVALVVRSIHARGVMLGAAEDANREVFVVVGGRIPEAALAPVERQVPETRVRLDIQTPRGWEPPVPEHEPRGDQGE